MTYRYIAELPVTLWGRRKMMKRLSHYSLWRSCVLGSINGLIFGVTAEVSRHLYVSGSFTTTESSLLYQAVDTADFLKWYFIPGLSLLTFTGASCFVHSYLARRLMSIISIWVIIGILAIIAWNIVWFGTAQFGPPSAYLSSPSNLPSTTWTDISPTLMIIASSFCF